MRYNPQQYAKVLMESLADTSPDDQDKILDNFTAVLAENNDLKLFDQIAEEFHKLELEKKGMKLAEVTSAQPLNHANEKLIVKQLNDLLGKNVELKKKVDESLIGGVMITVDDKLIDTSIKNELRELKDEMTRSE